MWIMADLRAPGGWSIKYGYVFLTGGAKAGKFLKIWMLFKAYDICIAWLLFGCCLKLMEYAGVFF